MPERVIHHADALTWLRERGRLEGASVVTSLPDVSELPAFGPGIERWASWFEDAAVQVMEAVPDEGVAIFHQSDVRHAGLWVDKSALLQRAAERTGARLLFHKIVCRHPPGTQSRGRATYSHLVAFSRAICPALRRATADVLPDAGFLPGSKSMGTRSCEVAIRFVIDETETRTIVDPFCGYGTVLAVANALGLDAVGVDVSSRMCKKARGLTVHSSDLHHAESGPTVGEEDNSCE